MLQGKLRDLKKSLKQSVKDEAYEQAARIRDEIHILENRLCGCSSDSNPDQPDEWHNDASPDAQDGISHDAQDDRGGGQ